MIKQTPIVIAAHRDDESPIFGDHTTHVTLRNEGGGPYVNISQLGTEDGVDLQLDELGAVVEAARGLVADVQN